MKSTIISSLATTNEDFDKMPGHWMLARMGKRVLRPGGLELTHRLLETLAIDSTDDVVEIADEGFFRTLRFVWNVLRTSAVRRRVLEMRSVFHTHRNNLCAIMLVAAKP